MKYLQKLGKALMLPVACLPICGILMGIGYLLCPASMQGGDITGFGPMVGIFLVKAGGALIDNMALLFVIGVGVGMSDDHDGTGGLAALASWLMITTLLSTGFVTTLFPSIADNADKTLAFNKIANPFIGILAGVILAIGRVVGETAALIYTAGAVADYPKDLMSSTRTLAVHMYNLSNEGLHTNQAYATAVVLLVLVLLINWLSSVVAKKITKK